MSSLTLLTHSTSQSAIIQDFISFATIIALLIHNNESIHQSILFSIELIYAFTTQTLELVEFIQLIFNYLNALHPKHFLFAYFTPLIHQLSIKVL
jgi:hypothetical protein